MRKTKTVRIKKAIRPSAIQALLKLEGKFRWEGDLDALRKRTQSRSRS